MVSRPYVYDEKEKARRRAYYHANKVRLWLHAAEYYNTHPEKVEEQIAYRREYRKRPEVIERMREYQKVYRATPEYREKNRERLRKLYWGKKQREAAE